MNSAKQIIIPAGERREWILINDPSVDWHIVQEAGSSLLLHIIALPDLKDTANAQHRTPANNFLNFFIVMLLFSFF